MRILQLSSIRAFLFLLVTVLTGTNRLCADLIPPGNKAVSHELVFVDSPLLKSHRLIAMPVRGFGGHEEVQPDRPFHFSTKYGTRLYVVPNEFVPPANLNPGEPLPFPSCEVPVSSTTYVSAFSPIALLRSTCRLVAVGDDAIQVELVDHIQLNSNGRPVTPVTHLNTVLPLLVISGAGLIVCFIIWRRARISKMRAVA